VYYYLSAARRAAERGCWETTANETLPACQWDIADPDAHVDHIVVLKRPDPGEIAVPLLIHCHMDLQSPRRNRCGVVSSPKEGSNGEKTMTIS
jgi:hypothetical protein